MLALFVYIYQYSAQHTTLILLHRESIFYNESEKYIAFN
jgi:hypothetical protein